MSRETSMTCRIDRLLTGDGQTVLRISGRIGGDDVDVLRAAIDQEPSRVAIDLEEVDLVASRVVNLFDVSEANGIELRNRPAYIREWVDQERAQMSSDSSDDVDAR